MLKFIRKMWPRQHFLVSLILAIIIYPFFGINSLLVFLTGFLIDIDHYFYYALKYRRYDFFGLYKDHPRLTLKEMDKLHIFHVWEFWLLLFISSFYSVNYSILLIGLIPHIAMDVYDVHRTKRYGFRAISLLGWLRRHLQ